MPCGDVLWQRLESARDEELRKLGEIVGLADCRVKAHAVLVEELSRDIRSAAGHSLLNWFRGDHDFPYKQMLIDVADKMAPGWTPLSWTGYRLHDRHGEIEVEETIWAFFEKKCREQLHNLPPEAREDLRQRTEKELRELGYSQALVSQISGGLLGAAGSLMGPALAYSVALHTASGLAWVKLWWVGHATVAASLGAGASLFAIAYAPFLVWWLGNTAYRKTIPAALYLIQVRKLREIEEQLG
jgi:uncharacterized protein YaaW (UPF0174 family)